MQTDRITPQHAELGEHFPAAYVRDAFEWISECVWSDLEPEDCPELTGAELLAGVERHYEGGLAAFAMNCRGGAGARILTVYICSQGFFIAPNDAVQQGLARHGTITGSAMAQRISPFYASQARAEQARDEMQAEGR